MIKFFTYFLQSIIIYIFFLLGKIMGISLSRKLFSYLFLKIGHNFKSKNLIKANLNIYSKDLTEMRRNEIISEMWKNYGKTFIEYIFLNYFKNNSNHIEIEGVDKLEKVLESKRPVIFVSGHFANYELMSMEIVKKKHKSCYDL